MLATRKILLVTRKIDNPSGGIAMAEGGRAESQSCRIYLDWNLNRETIRKLVGSLSGERTLQTTFGNVIAATRFKNPEEKRTEKNSLQQLR